MATMPWYRFARIVGLVPRLIAQQFESAAWSHEAAPEHFEVEDGPLSDTPAGKWARLTFTMLDARIVLGNVLPSPGQVAGIAAAEIDILVSGSAPDPGWNQTSNEQSRLLVGFAIGWFHAHPVKTFAMNGPGGGPNVVIEITVAELPLTPELVNSTFIASEVRLQPNTAFRVTVVQTAPSTLQPSWPDKWKKFPLGVVVGSDGVQAVEDAAAAIGRPVVWADDVAADPERLDALVKAGYLVAITDTALLTDGKVEKERITRLPKGVVVVARPDRLAGLTRAGLKRLP